MTKFNFSCPTRSKFGFWTAIWIGIATALSSSMQGWEGFASAVIFFGGWIVFTYWRCKRCS
ncbi:hypothetical protein HUU42_01685 [bacterium]|nr:hypothetical protein [bacterium]